MFPAGVSSLKEVVRGSSDELAAEQQLLCTLASRREPRDEQLQPAQRLGAVTLPDGWEQRLDRPTQRVFFIDHATRTTQWLDPRIESAETALARQHSALERAFLPPAHAVPELSALAGDAPPAPPPAALRDEATTLFALGARFAASPAELDAWLELHDAAMAEPDARADAALAQACFARRTRALQLAHLALIRLEQWHFQAGSLPPALGSDGVWLGCGPLSGRAHVTPALSSVLRHGAAADLVRPYRRLRLGAWFEQSSHIDKLSHAAHELMRLCALVRPADSSPTPAAAAPALSLIHI